MVPFTKPVITTLPEVLDEFNHADHVAPSSLE
jgi:hypothetical protein